MPEDVRIQDPGIGLVDRIERLHLGPAQGEAEDIEIGRLPPASLDLGTWT